MSAQRSATAVDTELVDQWRAIDGALQSLAQRSRARRGSDDEEEMEEPALRAATTSHHSKVALQRRLEEVTRERDELRVRLAAGERQLRSARARLKRLEQPKDTAAAGGSRPDAVSPPHIGPRGPRTSPVGGGAARSAGARWLRGRGTLHAMTTPSSLSRRLALSMAVAAMVTLLQDTWVSHDQGSSSISWLSVLVVAVAAAAVAGAALRSGRLRLVALAAATAVAACFACLTLTSVGLPMLVAAALGVGTLYEDRQDRQRFQAG